MLRNRLVLAVLASVFAIVPARAPAEPGATPAPEAAQLAPEAAQPTTAAAATGTGDAAAQEPDALDEDHLERIGSNFLHLARRSWKDAGLLTAGFVIRVVVWAVIAGLLGAALGLVLYLVWFRRVVALEWRHYKWVKWIWAVVFLVATSTGVSWAAAWFGGGAAVREAIEEDFLLDRVVAHLAIAAAMDREGFVLTGEESAEELLALEAQFRSTAGQAINVASLVAASRMFEEAESWQERLIGPVFAGAVVQLAGRKAVDELDPLPRLRELACGMVDQLVYPQVLTGLAVGPFGPMALAGLFHLAVLLVRRRRAAPAPVGDPGPQT